MLHYLSRCLIYLNRINKRNEISLPLALTMAISWELQQEPPPAEMKALGLDTQEPAGFGGYSSCSSGFEQIQSRNIASKLSAFFREPTP